MKGEAVVGETAASVRGRVLCACQRAIRKSQIARVEGELQQEAYRLRQTSGSIRGAIRIMSGCLRTVPLSRRGCMAGEFDTARHVGHMRQHTVVV